MRYRIKITTYKNGRKEYEAQFKNIVWRGLDFKGNTDILGGYKQESRKDALDRIDKHYAGNSTKQTITFEYITKP